MGEPQFSRYVAIGDSFTEGVGDPDPDRPNGVRGWADRVAEVLATRTDDFGYANLAIRGMKLLPILEQQLGPALELRPDLVSLSAGGNDLIRPKVDIDAIVAEIAAAASMLREAGATVVLFTHGDGGSSGVFGAIRGRVAIYNELLRDFIADDPRDIVLVDNWRLKDGHDLRVWDEDRLHLNAIGHQGVAINVLDSLGVSHDLEPYPIPDGPLKTARQQRLEDLEWARKHLAPWVGRRLRRTSSGDGLGAKYPTLTPLA
ncbi:MAG: SGNH/GDSL hydrolase family protein [Nocardioides sp.]|uniref:SGNH/GDSL hydrolase family protein n=1 Tax=Nocardioides sp. TaxID=35761 RepID=UPI0039E459F3